ncbi:S9 family peptidase [Candidatus Kapabacteria bacterium]|nr:S9 family peptidase [Candidatus Kapabacteria bacterium]
MNYFSKGLIALFVALISIPWQTSARTLTLEETVTLNYVSQVEISPDANHVAYTLVNPRTPYLDQDGSHFIELHVTDLNGNSRPFITGNVRISNISWGPKGKYIYYTAKRNEDKYTSIYRIPVDGGESVKLVSNETNISSYSINKKGHTLVYIAKAPAPKHEESLKKKGFKAEIYEESNKFNHLYKVDLNTDDSEAELVNINDNLLSVKFSPVNDQILTRTTPTPMIDDSYTRSQYQIYDLKGQLKISFKTEGKLGMASWSPDGKQIALIGAEDKNDPSAGRLFVGNSMNGNLTEFLKDYKGHVSSIGWTDDNNLVYIAQVNMTSEVGEINTNNGQVKLLLKRDLAVVRGLSIDKSGNNIVSTSSNSTYPRELVQISNGSVKRLTTTNNLSDIEFPKQISVTYNARDGQKIGGVLIYPNNYEEGKRYPMIIMVHGGPESHISNEWKDRYSTPIKYAASKDYVLFLPNYRGSTGRGVEFSKMGQADYAGAEFNDLVDAITHFNKIGLIDKDRVGITGASYGGYASAWAATALSEHFAASVMFVGISNQLSKFGTTDIPMEMYNVHARNYPWDKWEWMLERSPIYHTDKAKTPLLIMHGKNDTRVHPSQSMELYRYIKTRTETPVRLVLYPDEPHGNRKSAAQLDYGKRLMRWMDFYLLEGNGLDKMPTFDLEHEKQLEKENQ